MGLPQKSHWFGVSEVPPASASSSMPTVPSGHDTPGTSRASKAAEGSRVNICYECHPPQHLISVETHRLHHLSHARISQHPDSKEIYLEAWAVKAIAEEVAFSLTTELETEPKLSHFEPHGLQQKIERILRDQMQPETSFAKTIKPSFLGDIICSLIPEIACLLAQGKTSADEDDVTEGVYILLSYPLSSQSGQKFDHELLGMLLSDDCHSAGPSTTNQVDASSLPLDDFPEDEESRGAKYPRNSGSVVMVKTDQIAGDSRLNSQQCQFATPVKAKIADVLETHDEATGIGSDLRQHISYICYQYYARDLMRKIQKTVENYVCLPTQAGSTGQGVADEAYSSAALVNDIDSSLNTGDSLTSHSTSRKRRRISAVSASNWKNRGREDGAAMRYDLRRLKEPSLERYAVPIQPLFSCPFFKWDPVTHGKCRDYTLRRVRDVKEHLRQRHRIPFYCPCCLQIFPEGKSRDTHVLQKTCEVKLNDRPGGVTDEQMAKLSRKGPVEESPIEQWYSLFEIIFSEDIPLPTSPYLDSHLVQQMSDHQPSPHPLGDEMASQASLTPKRSKVIVQSRWDVLGLMNRVRAYGAVTSLGNLLSVTGDFGLAHAEKCSDYVARQWPGTGLEVLAAFQSVIDEAEDKADGAGGSEGFIKRTHILSGAKKDSENVIKLLIILDAVHTSIQLTVKGTLAETVRSVQLVCWLSIAFHNHVLEEPEVVKMSLNRSSACLHIYPRRHSISRRKEKPCWFPMLESATIAYGFPIPERTLQRGMHIPFDMAVTLIGASRVTLYDGGPVVLGYSGMLLPVSRTKDSIQWHYVPSNDDNIPMTIEGGVLSCPRRPKSWEVMGPNFSTECYVGWHLKAVSRAGERSDELDYSAIRKSGLCEPSSRLCLRNITVGFQQIATVEVGLSFTPYQSSRYYQMKRHRYQNVIRQLERNRVLVYDVNTDRGWLLSAADVVLHVIQYRLWQCPVGTDGGHNARLTLQKSSAETLRTNAGVEFEEGYNLQQMVLNTWESFEHMKSELHVQASTDAQSPLSNRNNLMGFEYLAFANELSAFNLREISFDSFFWKGPPWVDLVQADRPLVLFGNGFGELIGLDEIDKLDTCSLWKTLPSGAALMAVTAHVLKQMYDEEPGPTEDETKGLCLTSQKLEWHRGDANLFEACKIPHELCDCQRVQGLVSRKSLTSPKIIPPAELPDSGAVVFGTPGKVKRQATLDVVSTIKKTKEHSIGRRRSKRRVSAFFKRGQVSKAVGAQIVCNEDSKSDQRATRLARG